MRIEHRTTSGFTLVEVVVAIVVLTIGILGLAASAAATVRSMTESARVSGIARDAESVRERAYASSCATASGSDSVMGARVTWTAAPTGAAVTLRQLLTPSPTLPAVTAMTAVGPCR